MYKHLLKSLVHSFTTFIICVAILINFCSIGATFNDPEANAPLNDKEPQKELRN